MSQRICLLKLLIVVLIFLLPLTAFGKSRNPSLDETITIRTGPFFANLDTTINTRGQDVSVDENYDLDDVTFSIYGLWRITSRLQLQAGYTGVDKSLTTTLEDGINSGTYTFPQGSATTGDFKTDVFRLALGYAFMKSDSYEFGAELGVNLTSVETSLKANVTGAGETEIDSIDVNEPLPTIGLFYNYAFSEAWYLTTRAGLFSLEIGDIDGTIYDVFGGVEYRPWEHIGIGLAYTYTSADLTITGKREDTDIDYDYHGPVLYLVFGF